MTCGARPQQAAPRRRTRKMEITARGLWTLLHGMGFGALYLLACSGALIEIYRFTTSSAPVGETAREERFLKLYLVAMVLLAWAAVLTGAYVIYPWYRAAPPPGAKDLALFPQQLFDVKSFHPADGTRLEWNGRSTSPGFAPISITIGRLRLFQVWARPQKSQATSGWHTRFRPGLVCLSRRRRILRRHARQVRAGARRTDHSIEQWRGKVNTPDSNPPSIPNGSGRSSHAGSRHRQLRFSPSLHSLQTNRAPVKIGLNFYKADRAALGCYDGRHCRLVPGVGIPGVALGKRAVAMSRITRVSLALLFLSILLTFPR